MGNAPPSDADVYDHEVTSRDHFVTATWILGGAAVAAGAAGAVLYFFDTPSAEGLHISPLVTNAVAQSPLVPATSDRGHRSETSAHRRRRCLAPAPTVAISTRHGFDG